MKTLALLRTLRRQAVDDELGVICCRPADQARTYFQLALDAAAPPARVRALMDGLQAALAQPSPAAWGCLFDLVEEWTGTGQAAASSRRILVDLAHQAARLGAAPRLGQVLALYTEASQLWPDGWTDFLPGLVPALRSPSAAPQAERTACRLAVLDAWEQEGLPAPWGPAVLAALRRQLAQPPPVSDTALDLMETLRDPARLAETWTVAWRRTLAQGDGRLPLLSSVLEESRRLLPLLRDEKGYAELYQAAAQSVAHSNQAFNAETLRALLDWHPSPDGLALLPGLYQALGRVWDADAWRALACALCREPDAARRQARAREEAVRVLSVLLRTRPADWPAAVQAVAPHLPGFPDTADRGRWMAEAASFPDLAAPHVRALGERAGAAAAAAIQPWCALGDALGDRLRPADRRAWFGVALDLLAAAMTWNPSALAETIARWRGFVQTLLLAQSGYATEANRIMACQRETLDGPLYEACAGLRPGKSVEELDALHACGLGLGRK